jgi:hypothetical protein
MIKVSIKIKYDKYLGLEYYWYIVGSNAFATCPL